MISAVVFIAATFTVVHSQTPVSVNTTKGQVVGLRFNPNPATGASYDAFLGIPYAKQPIRFQLAVPPDSWSSRPAQQDGPKCPQPPGATPGDYSEDCLYINVFRPVGATASSMLPVMAYIHGSGFTVLSSSSKFYSPDFLVPEGVVLVTFNYRLGAPGFLSLGSKVAPGNLGLHDSWLALQWVHDEISAFGGDPSQVTLFGQSAGSAMTQFHYLSDFTSGLFARAIGHSGSAMSPWALISTSEAVRRAKVLAGLVGCDPAQNNSVILSCLQAANIDYIIGNQSLLNLPIDNVAAGTDLPFVPVIDDYRTAEKPFFNDSLTNLMHRALARAKPLITGFNTDEGIMKFEEGWGVWKLVESNLGGFLLQPKLTDSIRASLEKKIRSYYFPNTVDENKVEDLVRIYTDAGFAYPSIQMTRFFANFTYGYLFAYDGSWVGGHRFFTDVYKLRGVSHGDELRYLFYITNSPQYPLDTCTLNKPNLNMKNQMVQWWTTFAKTGSPGAGWSKVADGGYLVIDSTLTTINTTQFESRYYDFWADLEDTQSSGVSLHINLMGIAITLSAVWINSF